MTVSQHTTRTPPATIGRHLVVGVHRAATSLQHVHRYKRTPDGWKFTERVYEIRYLDTTPLAGSGAPRSRSAR